MSKSLSLPLAMTAALAVTASPQTFGDTNADAQQVERITVQGEFRSVTVTETPSSVTALTADAISQRSATHIENILNAAANVNFSGGSSRARFFQIRGIGERSQFVDPINPSVGLVVDGINYSGLGQAAQLFDISQVEIYRGPQSGRFGTDALAGMIILESTRPGQDFQGAWQLGVANYDEMRGGLALGGGLGENHQARFSVFQSRSDGFIENTYLGRDDTNKRSERVARLNVYSEVSRDWQVRTTLHYLRQDNGYDAFSLDNDRTTLSDEPGEDDLTSRALRVGATYTGWQTSALELSYTQLSADSLYSYDEDWTYVGIAPGWEYSSFDAYQRDRQDQTLEARWLSEQPSQVFGLSTDWVLGLYRYERDEDLRRDYFNWDTGMPAVFTSYYTSRYTAVYGELRQQLSDTWRLTTGLRLERYNNPYIDSRGITAEPNDTMVGGRLALSYQPHQDELWYATLARGYKGGGVNGEALGKAQDQGLSELEEFLLDRATFAPELLTSLEFGHKWVNADETLALKAAVFVQKRDDVQLKGWVNRDQSFVGYIQNAEGGESYGAELEMNYYLSDRATWFASLGLLETEIEGFVTEDGVDMSGRDLAHAPSYQLNTGFSYQFVDNLRAIVQVDAKDGFYYSDSHNSQADSVALVHARIEWQVANWQLSLWARNLTDETYGIRGFYFGNDPRNEYVPETYEQFGEPRRVGFTANYSF